VDIKEPESLAFPVESFHKRRSGKMKRSDFLFIALIFPFIVSAKPFDDKENHFNEVDGNALISSIEKGELDADSFVSSVKEQESILSRISPSAVANYMEALAEEGMLRDIPAVYFRNEEIQTALDVVMGDAANVAGNAEIYASYQFQVEKCRAH